MPLDATKIYSGPLSNLQISGSFGQFDVGYCDGADITSDPQLIPVNPGQQLEGSIMYNAEIRIKEATVALQQSASLMRNNRSKFIMTTVPGEVFTTTPALCQYSTARPFTATDGHMLVLKTAWTAVSESGFLTIS